MSEALADRCKICDREECKRIPGSVSDYCCDLFFLGGGDARCANCRAVDDCHAHAVDWRERCLVAEGVLDAVKRAEATLRRYADADEAASKEDRVGHRGENRATAAAYRSAANAVYRALSGNKE